MSRAINTSSPGSTILSQLHTGVRSGLDGIIARCDAIPAWQMFGCATCAVVARGILDQLSAQRSLTSLRFVLLHAPLSYLAIGWSLALVLALFAGWSRERAARCMAFGLPVILLVPLIDFASYAPGARIAGYFSIASDFGPLHLIRSAVLMLPQPDVTLGQQIVVQLSAITVAVLVWHARRQSALAVAAWAASTCVLYFYGSLAAITLGFSGWLTSIATALASRAASPDIATFGILHDFDAAMSATFLLLVILHACIGAAFWRSGAERQMARNLRAPRLLHYLLMFTLGLIISLRSSSTVDLILGASTNILGIILAAAMIGSLFIAAVWLNDLCDREIDRTSNADRPFASGLVDAHQLIILVAIAASFAAAAAATLGAASIAIFTILALLSFAYSVPPMRLRNHLGIAHAVIGAISAIAIAYPFTLLGVPAAEAPSTNWFALLALSIALLSTAKDLKDAQGDARQGVHTLVTVFSEPTGKWLTALASGAGALLLGYAVCGVHPVLLLGAAGAAIATFIMFRIARGDRLLLMLHLAWTINILIVAGLQSRA